MRRDPEAMPLVGVHDELRRHAIALKPAPELERLRRGTLGIALTDDDQVGVRACRMKLIGELLAYTAGSS